MKYLKNFLLLSLGVYTMYFVTSLLLEDADRIREATFSIASINILVGFVVYMLSHAFRVLRLVVLSADSSISIKSLWMEQIKANGVNLIIPFRMGEAYRLIAFKKFFGTYSNSFSILLCERFLDIILITFFLILSIYLANLELEFLRNLMYISIFILFVFFFMYFCLDEFLLIIHKIFVGKKTNPLNLKIIKSSSAVIEILKKTKSIFSSKIITCLAITLIIWILEILVFYFLLLSIGLGNSVVIFLAVSVALSSLLPSGPAGYGGIQLAFYLVGMSFGLKELVSYSFVYNVYIFGAAILLAGLLFLIDSYKGLRKNYNGS